MPQPKVNFRNSRPDQSWKLKLDDGAIYGPVSLADLQAWARQGRVVAENLISSDGKDWFPA